MSKLENLRLVTDAMYLQAQHALRGILQREAELRAELKKLDNHAQSAPADHPRTVDKMRGIGADVIWEAWLARTRAHLNLELAKTLALKEQHIGKVRTAFGKKSVSEKLNLLDARSNLKSRQKGRLDQAIDQSLWRKH